MNNHSTNQCIGMDASISIDDLEPIPFEANVNPIDFFRPSEDELVQYEKIPLASFGKSSPPPMMAACTLEASLKVEPTPAQALGYLQSQLQQMQLQLQQLQELCQLRQRAPCVGDVPGHNDVVCARGKFMYNHPGCVRFRHIVRRFVPQYQLASTRVEKSRVIKNIIDAVLRVDDNRDEVRFMKFDANSNTWTILSLQKIRDKVGHTLRESILDIERQRNSMEVRRLGRLQPQPTKRTEIHGTTTLVL